MTQLLIVVGGVAGLLVGGLGGLLLGGTLGWVAGLLLEIRDRLDDLERAPAVRGPLDRSQARPPAAKSVPHSGDQRQGGQRYPEQSVIDSMEDRAAEEAAADFDRYYRDVSRPRAEER